MIESPEQIAIENEIKVQKDKFLSYFNGSLPMLLLKMVRSLQKDWNLLGEIGLQLQRKLKKIS